MDVACIYIRFSLRDGQSRVYVKSSRVVYNHLLLRRETNIPGVAPRGLPPYLFEEESWGLFVHRGPKSYTPTAFGKLWTTPGVRCLENTPGKIPHHKSMTQG